MPEWIRTVRFLLAIAIASIALATPARGQTSQPAVTLTEDAVAYTLDNGIVKARVDKKSGDLVSMRYKNMEVLATIVDAQGMPDMTIDPAGQNDRGFGPFTDHQYGFWSHDAMGPRGTIDALPLVTINPATNEGERAEVAIRGISNGRKMGTGPGSNAQGNFIADVEIRWALGRGDSGVYTYSIFEHRPEYPATLITEARFCAKLADYFDWMSIADDEHHNKLYPSTLREGDKYVYTTNQFNNPAFGWSSTTKNVGFFVINPSMEYMSGGPTKIEFLGHRDTNQFAAPCVLNYWRSSHYGGAEVAVAAGEHWTKIIGPFMLYVNSGAEPQAIYKDARDQAIKESEKWPYEWVRAVDYPLEEQRATVKGQLILTDPQMPRTGLYNLMVGLTAAAYESSAIGFNGTKHTVDWQQDAKHYEYWALGSPNGQFSIPHVRAGHYTLHAFADGVLGEYANADVTIDGGAPVDLGQIPWVPARYGRQVWEIGVPNRFGSEFFKGDMYWEPTILSSYADLYPNDITYTIGKNDFKTDWFFAHVPRASFDAPAPPPRGGARAGAARGPASAPGLARGGAPTSGPGAARGGIRGGARGPSNGFAAPRRIEFELPAAVKGRAALRMGLSASSAPFIEISVNGTPVGRIQNLPGDGGTLSNHGQHGIWNEQQFFFDASMLRQGINQITLTIPAGPITSGVIYDYLRMELDESAKPPAAAQ